MKDTETVVFVEFDQDLHPFQVLTHETHDYGVICNDYDCVWSKRYGLLAHMSGFGRVRTVELCDGFIVDAQGVQTPVDTIYWSAEGIAVKESPRSRRLTAIPKPYTPETLLDGSTAILCDMAFLWCAECQDHLPDDIPDYCEHIWYCRICEEASTPTERCGHAAGEEE